MTVINTNVGAITARTYATNSSSEIEGSLEKLSSGKRVNSGSDDAAGLAVAYKLEAQLRSTNMAIQNASNGVSLIQTAGSGMNKVNSMLVRIREVSVQMANGIYTDQDRNNAQAEVQLLKEEIDKISENLQFNQVYLLDGSYEQSFRTGVSNEEVFGLSIISQRAEELGKEAGLKAFGTKINSSQHSQSQETISVSVIEAPAIEINLNQMGPSFQNFVANNNNVSFQVTQDVSSKFTIDQAGTVSASTFIFDASNPNSNNYNFSVRATAGSEFFETKINLDVKQNETAAVSKTSQSTLSVSESANVSFRSVDSLNVTDGALSNALQSFASGDSYGGTWSLGGADASDLNIDANGVVTAALSFEADGNASTVDASGSGTTGNQYTFDVIYTSSTGDKFTESVTLDVSNQNEEIDNLTRDTTNIVLADLDYGSEYQVTVDGVTLTATKTSTTAGDTIASIADALNSKNALEATPARGRFVADGANLDFVYDDAVGNHTGTEISDIRVRKAEVTAAGETAMATGVTGTVAVAAEDRVNQISEVSGISGILNSAANGDQFRITVDSNVITTAAITGVSGSNNFSFADLAAALNTANAGAADVTFGTNNDKLTITTDSTKTTAAHTITANSFQWIDDSTSTTTPVGSIGTATAANDSVAETVVIGGDTGEAAAAATFTKDSFVGITINDVDYTADINGGTDGVVGMAAALNANTDFFSLYTATVVNVRDLEIAAKNEGEEYAFTVTQLRALQDTVVGSSADQAKGFMGGTSLDNTAATQQEGENTNAFDGAINSSASGRDNSANGNNTDGAKTSAVTLSKATNNQSELSAVHSSINFQDNFTISLKVDDYAPEFKTFTSTNPFGAFEISGEDKGFFKIDSFDGTLRTTALFKSTPKDDYTIDIHYTGKNGKTFSNQLTLNRDPLQNTVKDSVADVDISTAEGATNAITILDRAINQMAAQEAEMGAAQNRLEHAIDYLGMAGLNTAASKSRIVDADFADISSKLAKHQILNQASTSMLAQANSSKQMLMQLLR
ncbi:Flagellin and related hook-associated proteins [SAR116 cluster alpha proteobacterium HIMB100]|nr:Flagellin and related hook-associated proteins [SAR116 cluster alpha proteobacterium HIMB100]